MFRYVFRGPPALCDTLTSDRDTVELSVTAVSCAAEFLLHLAGSRL